MATTKCACPPGWLQKMLNEGTKCIICDVDFKAGDLRGACSAIFPCGHRETRTHIYALLFHEQCATKFHTTITSNPLRNSFVCFFPLLLGDLNQKEILSIISTLREKEPCFGKPTGILCGNRDCKNMETDRMKKFAHCGACQKISYCSADCQREDWQHHNHRMMCKALRGVATPEEIKTLQDQQMLMSPTSAKAPPASDEEYKRLWWCPCYDQPDQLRYEAYKNGTCSNPGCTKKISGAIPFSIYLVKCASSPEKMHMIPTHYCSEGCTKRGMKT